MLYVRAQKYYRFCTSITSKSRCVGGAGDYQRNLFMQQQSRQRQGDLAAAQRRGQPYTSILPLPRGTSNTAGTHMFDPAHTADYESFRGQGTAEGGIGSRPSSRVPSAGYGGHLSALYNVRPFNDGPPAEVNHEPLTLETRYWSLKSNF